MSDWIEWNGGEMPVEPDTRVYVKFRNGHQSFAAIKALAWAWDHVNNPSDIIAYRIAEETNE